MKKRKNLAEKLPIAKLEDQNMNNPKNCCI